MGLGVPLLLGHRLLDLDLERLPEPDLDGEEDISNVLLLQKKNILSCNLRVRKLMIDGAISL